MLHCKADNRNELSDNTDGHLSASKVADKMHWRFKDNLDLENSYLGKMSGVTEPAQARAVRTSSTVST